MRSHLLLCPLLIPVLTGCESPVASEAFEHVVLLLHLDAADTTPNATMDASAAGRLVPLAGEVGWAESPSGEGLDLSGGGWIQVADLSVPTLDGMDWTAVLDLRLDDVPSTANRAVLQSVTADGDGGRTLLYVSPDCGGALASLVGAVPVCGTTPLTPGTWYQVAVSHDRTTDHVRLFLDGVLDGEGHVPAEPLGDQLLVGINRSLQTQHLRGAVDEVLLLAEALDEAGLAIVSALSSPWPEPTCTAPPAEPWLWLEAADTALPWAHVVGSDDAHLEGTCSTLSASCDDDYTSVPPELLPPLTEDFTVSVRARLDADDPAASDRALVQIADGRTLLYSDASCGGAAATYLGGAELCGPPLTPGAWSVVSLTWSAADSLTSLYLDGLLVGASLRPLEGGAEGLLLGVGRSAEHQWWDGAMDDLMVWDRVLSAAELSSLNAGGEDLCVP